MSTDAQIEAKHTPGEWSLPHFAEPDCGCECGYVLTDRFCGAVATVHASGPSDGTWKNGDNPPFAEAVANAHLIASAPDLLAALSELEDAILDGLCNSGIPGFDGERLERARIAARATMAKARGEQVSA